MKRMNWKELLCDKRPSEDKFQENERLALRPFERDYFTIVSSSYFRRLQKKAQVYVLDDNDFTRTRLTHSMEVAAIAEMLGKRIGKNIKTLCDEGKLPDELPDSFLDDLPMVLRCAGLLHDLGNPPFGHSGEEYIRDYFQDNEKKLKRDLSDQMWLDFINFEGNAHNVRIVTKLGKSSNPNDKGYGMDLTCAVINSLIKYPYNSLNWNERVCVDGKKKRGKIGFYHSEEWIIQKKVAPKTGTYVSDNKYLKNPIMLIMEAADDIAYATADVEDAVKKGIFEKCKIIDILQGIVPAHIIAKDKTDDRESGAMLNYVREKAMMDVVDNFITNYQSVMNGTYQGELIDDNQNGVKELKQLMYGYFEQRDAEAEIKYNSRKKIYDIMDYLITCNAKNDEDKTFSDWLVIGEMEQYKVKNEGEADQEKGRDGNEDLYHKYMTVVDFVAGMTDSYVSIFWNKLFSGELIKEKRKAYKEKCLKDIVSAKDDKRVKEVLDEISRVDSWDIYEIEIILKCYIDNSQISKADNSSSVIGKLFKNIRNHSLGGLLTKSDKAKLKDLFEEK